MFGSLGFQEMILIFILALIIFGPTRLPDIGRPFVTAPGVPADRVAMLREAFKKTMSDPEFLADAKKQHMELFHISGEDVETLVRRIYATPPHVVEISRQLSSSK